MKRFVLSKVCVFALCGMLCIQAVAQDFSVQNQADSKNAPSQSQDSSCLSYQDSARKAYYLRLRQDDGGTLVPTQAQLQTILQDIAKENSKNLDEIILIDTGAGAAVHTLELGKDVKSLQIYAPKKPYEHAPSVEQWLEIEEEQMTYENTAQQLIDSAKTKLYYQYIAAEHSNQPLKKGSIFVLRMGDFRLHRQVGAITRIEFVDGSRLTLWHTEDAAAMGDSYFIKSSNKAELESVWDCDDSSD